MRPFRLIHPVWMLLVILLGASLFPAARVQPALAAAPTPAPTGPQIVQVTAATLDKDRPVEAIAEIDLRLGGALYPGCISKAKRPTVALRTDDLDLTAVAFIVTCGWQPDETVQVSLVDPAGKQFSAAVQAVPSRHTPGLYEIDLRFQPGVDAPEGKYRFTLQGSAVLKVNVFFHKPAGARLYALADDPFQPALGAFGGQQRLRLEGFLPNEPVRLLAYRFEGSLARFYGVQDLTTDRKGQLIVETDLPEITPETEMHYFAYGHDTHFVALERFSADGVSKTRLLNPDVYCPGALAPRLNQPWLNQPQPIRAVNTAAALDIHYQPGFGSRITAAVPGDTPMRIYDYPKCIDHAYWWKVYIAKPFLYGWVPESRLGKYVVEAAQ